MPEKIGIPYYATTLRWWARPHLQSVLCVDENLGRFELVATPGEADLFFEIRFTSPAQYQGNEHSLVDSKFRLDPQFQLVIRDPKTNAILWGVTEHAEWAILQSNRNKNFDKTMAKLIGDVQALTQPSSVSTSTVTQH